MPIGSLGPMGRSPDPRRRVRLAVAAGGTILALGLLWWAGRGGDSRSPAEVRSASVERTTTTAHVPASSTTVYTVALDPTWLPKGSSSYSDSDAKRRRSNLPQAQVTAPSTTVQSATSLKTSFRHTTTTVTRARVTTTLRPRVRPTTSQPVSTVPYATTTLVPNGGATPSG